MIKNIIGSLLFHNKKDKEKTVMKKPNATQLLGTAVTILSIVGMFLSNKVHDREMAELKQEIISELAKKGE